MTRMAFVAVALCAPAAFAAADLHRAASAGASATVARVLAPAPSGARGTPTGRVYGLRESTRLADVPEGKASLIARARQLLVARDPVRATGEGPAVLTAAMQTTVPGLRARILADGYAAAPSDAPPAVQEAIWSANQLIGLPYEYGGGHGSFISSGYDCSGTVSFALHGGGMLSAPLDSGQFIDWEAPGIGRWVTVYANGGHAFVDIAGIRLDTSTAGDPGGGQGPRWRPLLSSSAGYVARHPYGY
jgi:cell wall-associated NlpC family hydrolase